MSFPSKEELIKLNQESTDKLIDIAILRGDEEDYQSVWILDTSAAQVVENECMDSEARNGGQAKRDNCQDMRDLELGVGANVLKRACRQPGEAGHHGVGEWEFCAVCYDQINFVRWEIVTVEKKLIELQLVF